MEAKQLKGGSLSGTWLMSDADRRFIRKEVSTTENREYGFYRWFSQLKKLQRLGERYPDLFPRVLDIDANAEKAWFDLEYVDGSVTVSDHLGSTSGRSPTPSTNLSEASVDACFAAFMKALDRLHTRKIQTFPSGIHLYLSQEVDRALQFCMEDEVFRAFTRYERIVFNGVEVPPLLSRVDTIRKIAEDHYRSAVETDTHGNVTLENTLYVPAEDRIVFIDLYEENFVDNVYNEYSQVLQSCSSRYELYNAGEARVDGPSIELRLGAQPGLDRFDAAFKGELGRRCTRDENIVVRLYEVTQFTRMLPFKRHVARDKMILFYGLASVLLDGLCREL